MTSVCVCLCVSLECVCVHVCCACVSARLRACDFGCAAYTPVSASSPLWQLRCHPAQSSPASPSACADPDGGLCLALVEDAVKPPEAQEVAEVAIEAAADTPSDKPDPAVIYFYQVGGRGRPCAAETPPLTRRRALPLERAMARPGAHMHACCNAHTHVCCNAHTHACCNVCALHTHAFCNAHACMLQTWYSTMRHGPPLSLEAARPGSVRAECNMLRCAATLWPSLTVPGERWTERVSAPAKRAHPRQRSAPPRANPAPIPRRSRANPASFRGWLRTPGIQPAYEGSGVGGRGDGGRGDGGRAPSFELARPWAVRQL